MCYLINGILLLIKGLGKIGVAGLRRFIFPKGLYKT